MPSVADVADVAANQGLHCSGCSGCSGSADLTSGARLPALGGFARFDSPDAIIEIPHNHLIQIFYLAPPCCTPFEEGVGPTRSMGGCDSLGEDPR